MDISQIWNDAGLLREHLVETYYETILFTESAGSYSNVRDILARINALTGDDWGNMMYEITCDCLNEMAQVQECADSEDDPDFGQDEE